MPLGRKQSAFRKTVSDLKSAAGLFSGGGGGEEGGGGGGVAAVRPRKRKLSEPGSASEVPAAEAPTVGAERPRGGLPRMGRSLANLASSIKLARGAKKRHHLRLPEKQKQQHRADEEEENGEVGMEVGNAEEDENDEDNGHHHDSTIFEEVAPQPKSKKAKSSPHQQKHQQPPPTKKERRSLKKKQKKNADLVSELLTVWEELRIEATPAKRVAELCDTVLKSGRGKLAELAQSHDTARVLEAVLKRGSEQQRWLVFEEIKDQLVQLAKSKYGRFVSQKMLKYGAKEHKAFVFRSIEGKAAELLKHRFASELVESAYNEFANAAQRSSILQEFYGPEMALFKSTSVSRLKDALEKRPGLVMQHLQQHLLALTQKDLVRHSLVQHLLLEYLEEALLSPKVGSAAGEAASIASLLENLRDNLVPMLHTREGTKAALLVVRHLSAKDLKRSLKSMKTFLCTSACNEHGYLFVIGLAECPGLAAEELHKLVLRELFDSLQELVDSQYGRKVLLYLLSPRNPLHFSPQMMCLIRPVESVPAEQLKQRLHQALGPSSSRLLSHVSGRMAELCQGNATLLFVMDVLRHCPGDKSACYAALADLIRQPFAPSGPSQPQQPVDESKQHIIERSAGHLMLKRLLPAHPELLRLINDFATDENITSWLNCNRSSFFLLQLYENCPTDCSLRERIGKLVKPDKLRASGYKGSQLLAEKLQGAAAVAAPESKGKSQPTEQHQEEEHHQLSAAKTKAKSRRLSKK